jgi:hypothetical protein
LDPASGKIDPDIAKPRPISPAFQEILDRAKEALNESRTPAGGKDGPKILPVDSRQAINCDSGFASNPREGQLKATLSKVINDKKFGNKGALLGAVNNLKNGAYDMVDASNALFSLCNETEGSSPEVIIITSLTPVPGTETIPALGRTGGTPGAGIATIKGSDAYNQISKLPNVGNITVKFGKKTANLLDANEVAGLKNSNNNYNKDGINNIKTYINGITNPTEIDSATYTTNIRNNIKRIKP